MATKKKAAPKGAKRKKAPAGKTSIGADLKKALLGVVILAAIVAVAGVVAHYTIGPEGRPPAARPEATPPHKSVPLDKPHPSAAAYKVPEFEIFPAQEPPPKPAVRAVDPGQGRPRVAIIIDDMGYDRKVADRFCTLDAPLTFSVLPSSPFRDAVVQKARSKGFSLMLHLPMEPNEYPDVDPGPGALLADMDPDRLLAVLEKNLDAVPYAIGVNNHMGSRLSAQADRMNQIFTVLKRRRLFYVDSRTTYHTKAHQAARLLQVPFAQRDVFLDNDQTPEAIRAQIRQLSTLAVRHGEAVGIGHPHPVTFEVLREMLPELKSKVLLVPIAELVHPIS
ncbi:MAG: divergent polysaccharide deacetylase family protein [Desulfobacterales bacterium]|nr:divergent polysaccharide deacetylase family protein [Desulfobacterales bacterium]